MTMASGYKMDACEIRLKIHNIRTLTSQNIRHTKRVYINRLWQVFPVYGILETRELLIFQEEGYVQRKGEHTGRG